MTFTSWRYFLFLPAVLLGWYGPGERWRKYLLLAACYAFYMSASPAYGLLLLATTALSWLAAAMIERDEAHKKRWLTLACLVHFGTLFVFKYLNFVYGVFVRGGGVLLSAALPLGISFFTFAVTGYLFDVYRGRIRAERSILDYALFVSFFPCLLAGPIGRAREFLPQLRHAPRFELRRVKCGLLRFLYGLFQKLAVADVIGAVVNLAYARELPDNMWLFVVLLYPLEIYFDFAGYSNMAIGSAQALGFTVPENFMAPFFSSSVRSFWKKWHISLTSWFREYLYFPLGGSRRGKARTCLNILIVFAVSGLWHGASFTYLVWGLLNGLMQVAELQLAPLLASLRGKTEGRGALKALTALLGAALTYVLIAAAFVFFRAETIAQAWSVLKAAVTQVGVHPFDLRMTNAHMLALLACVLLCALLDALKTLGWRPQRLADRVLPYYLAAAALIFATALLGVYGTGFDMQSFVYFKY